MTVVIAIAFPKHEADRARLRRLVPKPLPAIYVDGEDRPCAKCGMLLNVGPRVAATSAVVYCPECGVGLAGRDADLIELGNPDSRDEELP
jgi:hypothetical protein